MIVNNSKNTYVKFTTEIEGKTLTYYIPVYCWKVVDSDVVGLVPALGSNANLLEVQGNDTDKLYGDFQFYLDESQIESDKDDNPNVVAFVYPKI